MNQTSNSKLIQMVWNNIAYVNGTVLSGAGEEDDVVVEIAFEEEYFNASAVEKYNSMQNDTLDRVQEISDGDTFALTLSIESLMGNTALNQTIYIKVEELHQNGTVRTQYNSRKLFCRYTIH